MKNIWKNVLGVALIAAISSGAAIGTSTYLMNKNQRPVELASGVENTFKQPYRLTNYGTVAAENIDFTTAAESAIHGVVHIKATANAQASNGDGGQQYMDPFEYFFGFGGRGGFQRPQQQPRVGAGSGVIISTDGYIITNNHVIDGADELEVTLNDNRKFPAKIIGADPTTDIALIKIEATDLPTIPFGDSEKLKVGEWVLAVGNPFNLNSTVTAGIVSAKARAIGATASNGQAANIQSFIQTDAAINQGNSGGALVNARGELVGINAMLYSPTGAYSGYGFAIPTSIMTKVVADLKQFGTVQRALLGITGTTLGTDLQMDERLAEEMKKKADELGVKEGVLIAEVVEGGSAAGVLKSDDVIVGIDGKKVHKFTDLQEVLAKHRPGDKVKVKVIRDKKEKEFVLTLKNSQGNTKVVKDAGMELLGAAFKPVSSELKRQLNLGYGLEVTGVSNGKMADAGIRKGFIILKANNVQMKSVEDLEQVLKAAAQSPEQVLFITGMFPSGKRASYAVDLSQE